MSKNFKTTLIGAALFLAGLFSGQVLAAQGRMQNAADALTTAITELNHAEHNKGGHREKAIGLAQQALDEVRAGIAAGRQ
jgi:hypothetical protein